MTLNEFLETLKRLSKRNYGYELMYTHFTIARKLDKHALDGLVEYLAQEGVNDEQSFIRFMEEVVR